MLDEIDRLIDRQARVFGDVQPADGHGQHFALQPVAMTRRTRHRRHEVFIIFAHTLARRVAASALDARDDAFKRSVPAAAARFVRLTDEHLFALGSIEEDVELFRLQRPDGHVERNAVRLADGVKIHRGNRRLIGIAPAADVDGAFADGFGRVRDDSRRVDDILFAQPAAFRAGAVWIVE